MQLLRWRTGLGFDSRFGANVERSQNIIFRILGVFYIYIICKYLQKKNNVRMYVRCLVRITQALA